MGGLGSGEWMPTTFVAVAPRTQLFSAIFRFWTPLGWEGEARGIGKDGWVGICGVDADNFASSCSADAAVLGYLSILDVPGMGGRGQGDREGWVGWDLWSGC